MYSILTTSMESFLQMFIFIPMAGLLVNILIPSENESLLSKTAFITAGAQLLTSSVFFIIWLAEGHPSLNLKELELFSITGYIFFIDFFFDKITAVYLLTGSFLTFLVTIYSRSYLHRESGYKRFFNTILFFYLGYNLVILSGNLETLFIGWEILGISSFLLIAFYRHRYLPVKNAVKVFSIYRVGDVGIILAMWASHHLWHQNITFQRLNNYELVHEHLQNHTLIGVFISVVILVAAAAKSAQLPFSSWLPRAMEGPTPSSAIFYGSLSVHIGVFLLLRTYPFWEHQLSVRILAGLLGLLTAIISTGIARAQSSVKSQIAYSSIAQIGIIFIEVAAGFENLALFHFAGNAFLRTYQLLVSPSVVTYLIREQFYNFTPRKLTFEDSLPKKLEYSLFILCLNEWNLDSFMYRYFWNPLKWTGRKLDFLTVKTVIAFFAVVYGVGLVCVFNQEKIPDIVHRLLPFLFSFTGLVMVLKAFAERKNTLLSWILVIMNHYWVALAITFNEYFLFSQIYLYLSGITASGIFGYLCLIRLKSREADISLKHFHGHSYRHRELAFAFLLACLGLAGFPITPAFIGEDLIFTHIREGQIILASFTALSFIINGLAIIRIYARVFLGPNRSSPYDMAYRSS